MAVIPTGVTNMVASTVSWLITIVTILIIVKIVQLARSAFGGLGGGSSGSSGKSGKNGSDGGSGKSKDNRTKEQKAKDKEATRVAKDKFDPYNPANVQFLVCDEDDAGIQDAKIYVKPAYATKRKYALVPSGVGMWAKNKNTYRVYGPYLTNQDGFYPSRDDHVKIGSGVVSIDVKRSGFIFNDSQHHKHYELIANEERLIVITLKKKGEKDQFFEPHIKGITIGKTKDGKEAIKLDAIIK